MESKKNLVLPYRAAQNNEILRLIWAGYKEKYLHVDENVFFTVTYPDGKQYDICSREDAQRHLYDSKLKMDVSIRGNFQGREVLLDNTEAILNELQPYLSRAYSHVNFSHERWSNWLRVSWHAVQNEALAIADKIVLDQEIEQSGSILDYAFTLTPNESFAFFSRYAAYFGRYDMPFSKMKLPISNRDALKYAPEFGADVPVILAAINRQYALINSAVPVSPNNIFEHEYPEVYALWENMLIKEGLAPAEYVPIPIHPLSLELYEDKLSTLIASNDFVIDREVIIQTKAGLSYRSMISKGKNSRCVMKLPVPLQMTGYIRYIDWEELTGAPQLSGVLANVFNRESNFGNRLRLDQELLTVCVAQDRGNKGLSADAPYLSYLIRENQSRDLTVSSITMPLASIFSASSLTGKFVLVEIMEKAGVETSDQAVEYFHVYVDKTLRSVLSLYLRYGILLEAHQQNMGITFGADGQIEILHYHDIAYAVYIYKPVYLCMGLDERALSGIPFVSESARSSCMQFVHTTLLLNFFPAISIISDSFRVPENQLMELVLESILSLVDEEREEVRRNSEYFTEVFERFFAEFEERTLGSPVFPSKRLLGRLFEQSQTPYWGQVPNHDATFEAVGASAVHIENPLFAFYTQRQSNEETRSVTYGSQDDVWTFDR